MKRIVRALSGAVLGGILISSAVWAQSTAQINGTVKDQTGAVLPGVEITATQTETGISRSVVSDEAWSLHSAESCRRTLSSRSCIAGIPHLCADRNRPAG